MLEHRPGLARLGRELAGLYAARTRVVTDEALQAMGQALWAALSDDGAFAADFATAKSTAGRAILPLILESDEAAIQQLPWETLYHPDHGFLGQGSGFTLSRRLYSASAPDSPLPPPMEKGPLRVLLFTSLPDDLDAEKERLNVEAEQARVQEALAPWVAEGLVVLEMPNDGRFATLQRHLQHFQPHLLFLSGHGRFVDRGPTNQTPHGIFLFESEIGHSDPKTETEILPAFDGTGVQGVVLSACQSGKASSEALNQGLTRQLRRLGIPHVIGMRESVLDRAGIQFAQALCESLAAQERIDVALQQARAAITQPLSDESLGPAILRREESLPAEMSLGQWSLPLLLSGEPGRPLIDWDFEPQPPARRDLNQSLRSITLPPHFVGRRAELRTLQSRLRRGELTQLLITGPGGQGKTALAGRLAQDLQGRGYEVLAWSARPESDWDLLYL